LLRKNRKNKVCFALKLFAGVMLKDAIDKNRVWSDI